MAVQDPEKFKSRMHSLAYGQAMEAAARDYQKVRNMASDHSNPEVKCSADPAVTHAPGNAK